MTLSLRQFPAQKQELRLNAQLLQSLRILHLPQHKLEAFVEQEAATNPFLVIARDEQPQERPVTRVTHADALGTGYSPSSDTQRSAMAPTGDGPLTDAAERVTAGEGFREHLLAQLSDLSYADDHERHLVEALVQSLEPDGYLRVSLDELAENFGVDKDDLEDPLILLQDEMDPAGVGARNLKECFELQARRHHSDKPRLLAIVQDQLDAALAGDVAFIARAMGIPEDAAESYLAIIQNFDKSPGRQVDADSEFVSADFRIEQGPDGQFYVVPLRRLSFRVEVRPNPDALIERSTNRDDKKRLRDQLQAARAVESAVLRRDDTEIAVVESIVRVQQGFFREGATGLRPLTQRDIADDIGMHESTISRVVAGRYLESPSAEIHELREFFSRALPTESGGEASSMAVKVMIRRMVHNEKPGATLSDNEIAEQLLSEHGIHIARRTVAKYRKNLGIPTSSQRRRKN